MCVTPWGNQRGPILQFLGEGHLLHLGRFVWIRYGLSPGRILSSQLTNKQENSWPGRGGSAHESQLLFVSLEKDLQQKAVQLNWCSGAPWRTHKCACSSLPSSNIAHIASHVLFERHKATFFGEDSGWHSVFEGEGGNVEEWKWEKDNEVLLTWKFWLEKRTCVLS